MSVKDRMKAFLKHIGKGQGDFEKIVGLSNGFVNNIGDSIREASIKKITKKFPELNTNWLKTGEGSMIKGELSPFDPSDPINVERASIVALKKKVAMIESMLYEQAGRIKTYEECLNDIERSTTVELIDLKMRAEKRR